ncbi:hypothetical protein [Chitinophaga sp. MM2321]|uniref:hypothetical protein n=1 Tax=Chitinophaga sp. MM2321 TaxID=3137178 RepID=UPI0032D5A1FA
MAPMKPIGWYLKEADSLITSTFDASFESLGITRFHWQVLKNIKDDGQLNKKDYYPKVSRFITATELDDILSSLISREWVMIAQDNYFMTDMGKHAFAKMETLQQEVKEKMMSGSNPEDYNTTVKFLSLIINNLGGKA